jgi:hypothetical protein
MPRALTFENFDELGRSLFLAWLAAGRVLAGDPPEPRHSAWAALGEKAQRRWSKAAEQLAALHGAK